MMKSSINYIDSLTPMRGLAALWVMAFHIDVSLFYRDLGALLPRDATGILSHGYLWVDFFFLLSGFIMVHVFGEALSSGGRVLDYLWARLARIYPLHLVCLGLVVVIALGYPLFVPDVKDGSWETFMAWKALPSNLMLTHAMNQHTYLSWDIVSWSIGAEWWTYVITVPVIVWLYRGPLWLSGLVGTLAMAGLTGLVYALPDHNLDITYNYGFVRCLCEFIIGIFTYRLYRDGHWMWARADIVVLGLFCALIAVFHFRLNDLLVIPLFVLLILGAARNRTLFHGLMQGPVLQYIGRISYSLYLVHGVVFSALWFLLPWIKTHYGIGELPLVWKLGYAALFCGLTVVIAAVTYVGVEKPARLWLLSWRRSTSGRVLASRISVARSSGRESQG